MHNDALSVVFSLILIDNYDDVIEHTEEIMRPLLFALVDRTLNNLAIQTDGLLKKYENDKYLFIFPEEKIDGMKESGFDILSQVRSIEMGNKIPITLSMGIGMMGRNPAESMNFARAALDLALGRGGDQAAIKDREKFDLYGESKSIVESRNRVRARVKMSAFEELLAESKNVIVMGHRNMDLDCLGAAAGIRKIASAMGVDSFIVMNDDGKSVSMLRDQLIKKKDSPNVFINSEGAAELLCEDSLLVIVDVHRPSLVELTGLLEAAKRIVVIDHHRKASEFISGAILTYHEPYASSTCELITEMLQYSKNNIQLDSLTADALLAGIVMDSKNFSIKTGAKTFEAGAFLRRNGADSIRVKLLFQNDIEEFRARAQTISDAETLFDTIAFSIVRMKTANPALVCAQAADEMLTISGIQASFVFCEMDGFISVSARSLDQLNVQKILEKLGGGGHRSVAGLQIEVPMDEAVELVKKAVREFLEEDKK